VRRVALWIGAVVGLLALTFLAVQLWFSRAADLPAKPGDSLRVATFNVHYIWLGGEKGPWTPAGFEVRKDALDKAFKALDADIVAFQEMESFARGGDGNTNLVRDWLRAQNPDYAWAATGRAEVFPPTQPVMYRPDRLTVRDDGWFFFSETPDRLYARTFNGSWPAFCSWVRFEDTAGKVFTLVNVHFDFSSRMNRRLSAELVAERMADRARQEPVVLVGDINALSGSYTLRQLQGMGLTFPSVPGATVHFNRGLHLFGAIDRIGATQDVRFAGGPYVLQRRFDGQWPSDHHPVVADLHLP